MIARIEIRMEAGRSTVLVDGEPVRGLVGFTVERSIGDPLATVTLTLRALDVTITADEATIAGWKP